MFDLAKLDDAAASPAGFGVWEDFLFVPMGAVVSVGTAGTALVDVTSAYSETLIENNLASIAAFLNTLSAGPNFTFTAIASGTLATNAGNGGLARIACAANADNSGGQIQGAGIHVIDAGNGVITFKAKTDLGQTTTTTCATQSDYFVGLFPVDASLVASVPDNGIYFQKADGATTISCVVRVGGSNTVDAVAVGTEALAATKWGISVVPTTSGYADVAFSMNGVEVLRRNNVSVPANTIYLTPSIAFQSGDTDTGTKFMDIDYIGSFQKRV